MKNKKTYLSFDDMRLAYDKKSDSINITSGDSVLKQEKFRITLTYGSPLERRLRALLGRENLLASKDSTLPYYAELPKTDEFEWNQFPLGVDQFNEPVVWDIKRDPHALITGSAGKGKSVAINSFIFHAASHPTHWDIYNLDFTGHPDSQYHLMPALNESYREERHFAGAVKTIDDIHRIMNERYTKNLGQGVLSKRLENGRFKRILFIIDGINSIFNWERSTGDIQAKAHKQYNEIMRLGHGAGIHVVTSTQLPDVTVLRAETKSNIGMRLVCGKMSATPSLLSLDSRAAEQVEDVKGRGIARVHDDLTHLQIYYSDYKWFDDLI